MIKTYTSQTIKAKDFPYAPVLSSEIEENSKLVHALANDLSDKLAPTGESWHVYYKSKFNLTDYMVTSIESQAKGIRKNAMENLKLYKEDLESQIKQMNKKIEATEKELANILKVKKLLIKRSKARKEGKAVPEFMPYEDCPITEKDGIFTVRRGQRKALTFDNDYLLEVRYIDPHVKELKNRISRIKDKQFKRTTKLASVIKKIKEDNPSICFGSKGVFKSQYTKYEHDHENWSNLFHRRRTVPLMLVGRADGKQGNYMCSYDINTHTLSIITGFHKRSGYKPDPNRKHETMKDKFVEIKIPNVVFPYGQENVNQAVMAQELNKQNEKLSAEHQVLCFPAAPVTWCIYNRKGDFQITCTITVPDAKEEISFFSNGCVAFDSNYDNLSYSELDDKGNLLMTKVIHFDLEGNSSKTNELIISEALEEIFLHAKNVGKPVAMENLENIKKELMYEGSVKSRRISMFANNTITDYAERKSKKYGIKLKKVNPAYTSQIGKMKYMQHFGISIHQAASYVIGRRAMGFKDKVPKNLKPLLSENMILRHHWSQWSLLMKKFKKIPVKEFYSSSIIEKINPSKKKATKAKNIKKAA